MMFWVAQLIGFIGMAMLALAYIQKKRQTILAFNIASAISWTIHFLILGATTGAAMNAMSIGRAAAFYAVAKTKRRKNDVFIIVVGAFLIVAAITWQGYISVLPLVAMLLSTTALWQKDPQRIRAIVIASTPFWIVYNVITGSIAGVATEVMVAVSAAAGLYAYRRKKR